MTEILRVPLSSLEEFANNDENVKPDERTCYIIGLCMGGVVADFGMDSLKDEPFYNRKDLRPNKKLLILELKRRSPYMKNITNKSIRSLVELLVKMKDKLSDQDVEYLQSRYNVIVDLLKEEIAEKVEKSKETRVKITLVDRLRFVHCLIRDDVKVLYLKSQNSMLRSELDARNSTTRIPTFHEKITTVFNDESFVPESMYCDDLHDDFSEIIELKLSTYCLTVEKAKDILSSIKPMIVDLITRYEQSGMGAGNRNLSADDWGLFDITLCDNGDDRKCFLNTESQSYLLYWWKILDQEELLHFSCVKLPNELTANSSHFSLVSDGRSARRVINSPDLKSNLSSNIKLIGNGVNNLADIALEREIEVWEDKKFELELTLFDTEDERRVKLIKNRINVLDDKINKRKRTSDED